MYKTSILLFAIAGLTACGAAKKNISASNAHHHYQAVKIVMETHGEYIRELDGGDEVVDDLKPRQWKVKRFRFAGLEFNPDQFIVTYFIDDRRQADWVVNVKDKTAITEQDMSDLPQLINKDPEASPGQQNSDPLHWYRKIGEGKERDWEDAEEDQLWPSELIRESQGDYR